jgi:type IV secretory pathway VirJ component
VFGRVRVFHAPIGREVAAGRISGDGGWRRVDNRT